MDPNARSTLQKYWFREFMILSSLKNRLRSHTRVATFRFQSVLDFKNRLRSRTRVATFKFQSALDLKNRLRSRTRVTPLMIKYVLETRLRACIQRVVFCIHKLKAKP